jgi:glycosyltransferase involved in cell wall biosynthesis
MRIALVSRESFPLYLEGEVGGIGRYVETTARGLAGQGAQVVVLAQNLANECREKDIGGVKVLYLPKWEDTGPWSWRLRAMEAALLKTEPGAALWADVSDKQRRARIVSRYLARFDRQGPFFDLVEFPDCSAEAFYYSRRSRRPLCVTRLHGPTQMLCDLNGVRQNPSLKLLIWAERQAAAHCDHATAPSRFAARQAVDDWAMDHNTPYVLPNMLDTEVFSPPKARPEHKRAAVILFSGRLERRKGLMAFPETLAKVLEAGVDFECRLVGRDTDTGPGGCSMKGWLLDNCISEVRKRLVFLGQMDKPKLIEELRGADLGLYLSSYETFGYACLEAQACGLPVVATRLGGTGEVTRHGLTGLLVDPEDCQAVAQAVKSLLEQPERLASMGRAAREHARSEYSLEALSARTLELYQSWTGRS